MGVTHNTDSGEPDEIIDNDGGNSPESTTSDEPDTDTNTDGEDEDDGEDPEDSDDDDADDGEGDEPDDSDDDPDDDDDADDDSEPEIRRPKAGSSNAEWAAYRKQEKAKKDAQGGKDDDPDEDDEDDLDGLSPEDAAAFDKRIDKHLAPYKSQIAEQEVDSEIAAFIKENPDFKSYETKVKRWAMHPNRKNVPVQAIFFEVAGKKLLSIGAKRGREADKAALKTRTRGGVTPQKGSKSYKEMPLDDFSKELDQIKYGGNK